MHKYIYSLFLSLLLPSVSYGTAQGYPYDDPTAIQLEHDWHATAQWYSGVVERCTWIDSAPPTWIENWIIMTGTVFTVGTNTWGTNSLVYTNFDYLYGVYTTTNCMDSFTYVLQGTTMIYRVPVSRTMIAAIETTQRSLYPYFVSTNTGVAGGSIQDWFDNVSQNTLPLLSEANVFNSCNVGSIAAIVTNAYGYVTGGKCDYTKQTNVLAIISVSLGQAVADKIYYATNFDESYALYGHANGTYKLTQRWNYGRALIDTIPPAGTYIGENEVLVRDVIPQCPNGVYMPNTWIIGNPVFGGIDDFHNHGNITSLNWVTYDNTPQSNAIVTVSTNWIYFAGPDSGSFGYWKGSLPADSSGLGSSAGVIQFASNPSTMPWLHHVGGQNIIVTVAGFAWATNAGPYSDLDYIGAQHLLVGTQAQETVTMSSGATNEWKQLSTGFIMVTNIVVSNVLNYPIYGDMVEILYTNLVTYGSIGGQLLDYQINERMATLEPLVWTWETPVWTNKYHPTDNYNEWPGGYAESHVSWADACALANSYVILTNNLSSAPYKVNAGYAEDIALGYWFASHSAIMQSLTLQQTNITNSISRDFYFNTTNYADNFTYNCPIAGAINGKMQLYSTLSGNDFTTTTFGDLVTDWSFTPLVPYEVIGKGWRITGQKFAIIKWLPDPLLP